MRLNVEFKEGRAHAWLVSDHGTELFIQRPMEGLIVTGGHLSCWVPSHQAEEIRADIDGETFDPESGSVFLCCASPKETKLYAVEESVTYAGGDVLLFIKPIATFH